MPPPQRSGGAAAARPPLTRWHQVAPNHCLHARGIAVVLPDHPRQPAARSWTCGLPLRAPDTLLAVRDDPEAMENHWGDEQGGEDEPGEGEEAAEPGSAGRRRFSLGQLGRNIRSVASNIGAAAVRTAAAAGEMLTDAELRSRSAALLAES